MKDVDEGVAMPQNGLLYFRSSCRNRHGSHYRLEFWSQHPQQMRRIVHIPAVNRREKSMDVVLFLCICVTCIVTSAGSHCTTAPHTIEIVGQCCIDVRGFSAGEALHRREQTRSVC